jgi:hypothetical protein
VQEVFVRLHGKLEQFQGRGEVMLRPCRFGVSKISYFLGNNFPLIVVEASPFWLVT